MATGTSDHIVRAFDEELKQLTQMIVRMGGLGEEQIRRSITALKNRNDDLAQQVIDGDDAIDDLEHEVLDRAVHLIALRQPMAIDLREIITAIRIAGDLERIADYATNVAKRALLLNTMQVITPVKSIPRIARQAEANIRRVLEAYIERDMAKAISVWESDDEIDEMYLSFFRETLTYMIEDPRTISPCSHLLFIGKNIERIGDHTTNIAEMIYYLISGEQLSEEFKEMASARKARREGRANAAEELDNKLNEQADETSSKGPHKTMPDI